MQAVNGRCAMVRVSRCHDAKHGCHITARYGRQFSTVGLTTRPPCMDNAAMRFRSWTWPLSSVAFVALLVAFFNPSDPAITSTDIEYSRASSTVTREEVAGQVLQCDILEINDRSTKQAAHNSNIGLSGRLLFSYGYLSRPTAARKDWKGSPFASRSSRRRQSCGEEFHFLLPLNQLISVLMV